MHRKLSPSKVPYGKSKIPTKYPPGKIDKHKLHKSENSLIEGSDLLLEFLHVPASRCLAMPPTLFQHACACINTITLLNLSDSNPHPKRCAVGRPERQSHQHNKYLASGGMARWVEAGDLEITLSSLHESWKWTIRTGTVRIQIRGLFTSRGSVI